MGENGIFVHNGCGDEIPWSSKEVKSGAEDLEKGALSVQWSVYKLPKLGMRVRFPLLAPNS